MLRDLALDARLAIRMLLRRPAFTLVALFTVALAIGANTLVFSVVRGVILRPPPYAAPERLVVLWPDHFFSHREVDYLREHSTTLTGIGAWVPGWSMTLTGSGEATKLAGARVTANLFGVLGVSPQAGRLLTSDEELPGTDNAVILSSRLWKGRFGSDSSIIGGMLMLDGSPHRVVGVMRPEFELYQPQTEVWRALADDRSEWYYLGNGLMTIGRLRPGATIEQARQELRQLLGSMREAFGLPDDFGRGADVAPLQNWLVGPLRPMLLVTLGAVGFVLLLAGANLASLLLARAADRQREIAVRAALGAGRGRLVRQMLAESVVLAATGGAMGLLLAVAGLGAVAAMLPAGTPFVGRVGLDPAVLGVSVALTLGTGILFGLVPAFTSARHDLQSMLRGGRSAGPGLTGRRIRAILVAGEVAISMVFLAGTALMTRTLYALEHVDPGFRLQGILTFGVQPTGARFRDPELRVAYYQEAFQRLRALPGILSVGTVQHLPLSGTGWGTDVEEIEGTPLAPGATPPRVGWRVVGGDYFKTLGVPLLAGRLFQPTDRSDAPSVILVNQTMARRLWPGASPLGKRVRAGNATRNDWATIVGVVGDVRHEGLNTEPIPELYQPYEQDRLGGMTMVIHTSVEPRNLAANAIDVIRGIDPNVPITAIRSMEDMASASVAERRSVLALLAGFAAVGLMLGVAGIYGVVSHHVAAGTREIGIRIALGAAPHSVVGASLTQGIRLATAGVVFGALGASLVSGLLRTFVFQVRPGDPLTLGLTGALLLVLTALASWVPARRAARVDPVEALRAD